MTFTQSVNLTRHIKHSCLKQCNGRRDVFPGKIHRIPNNLVERLFRVGVMCEESHLYFEDFITFDFECILSPVEDSQTTKTVISQKHIPVSAGVCSSHDDIRTEFLIDASPETLIKIFLKTVIFMRRRMLQKLFNKWKPVFDSLLQKIITHRLLLAYEEAECNLENLEVDLRRQVEAVLPNHDTCAEYASPRQKWIENLIKLKHDVVSYLRPIVVLGFNSSKYDLKLIAPYLLPLILNNEQFLQELRPLLFTLPARWHGERHSLGEYSHLEEENLPEPADIHVIKQHGGYTQLSWGQLLDFKDFYKFCSPNTNLASFMKINGAEESKGFFPYQCLSSFDNLSQNHLPQIEDFNTGLLAGENLLGKTPEEIKANYEYLKQVWEENEMENMQCFLKQYQLIDVRPFAVAVKNWLKGYHKTEEKVEYDGVTRHMTDGVDILKSCVSVPGDAKKLMDQYTHKEEGFQGFYLFGDKEQDLAHLFRDTICGGPSIVYNREVNHGQGIIIAHDCNAMYSSVLLDQMPCGPATRYCKVSLDAEDADPKFVMSISFNMESRLALQYLSDPDNKLQTYKHAFNQGHEVFIGPYRVDAISDYYGKVLEINSG